MVIEDNKLVLGTDQGSVTLPSGCFVVFIDETGHELFEDPKYPIFGLGGCAVLVGDYDRLICAPWDYLKENSFDGGNQPLHASGRDYSEAQFGALSKFFTEFEFCRVAAMLSTQTDLKIQNPPYELAAATLINRILEVVKHVEFSEVALIFEASSRGDPLAQRYFSHFQVIHRGNAQFPVKKFLAQKSCTAGLEVADFVMHAAGTTTRTYMQTGKKPANKDFAAVFQDVDDRLTSFLQITEAKWIESDP